MMTRLLRSAAYLETGRRRDTQKQGFVATLDSEGDKNWQMMRRSLRRLKWYI